MKGVDASVQGIDSNTTHNFIHCKVAKELNCFLYLALECQVMVANAGTINCSGKCHNITILGVQWLQSLGTVASNFQELFLKFSS